MRKKILLFVFLLSAFAFVNSLAQEMPLVYDVENTGADYPKPPLPSVSELPAFQSLTDPFEWSDGRSRISNFSDWRYRRAEIGAEIQQYEIGEKPVRPDTIQARFSKTTDTTGTLTVIVTVNGKTLTLTSAVALPSGTGPFPAVIGMNSSSGSIPSTIFSSRNIARITYSHNQVTTYGNHKITDPYYQLYPRLNTENTGQYSAWAWGVSRLIDGLELVKDSLPIDLKHLAVSGCSYAGKLAIFAGAFDERIALTIGQESGGGGYTTWRVSELKAGSVETLEATDYNWFSDAMRQFAGQVPKLPEDHHELMAMVAPRALLVTGNPDYVWLSDESGHVGSNAAKEVWKALGVQDRFGYSIMGGHSHCAVPNSQIPEIEAFVDKFLLGKDTTFNVATTPYTTDLSPWITWTTPTLSNGTSLLKWTTLSYPPDRQTDLDTAITFKWSKTENVEKYFIQVSTNPTFTTVDKSDSTTTDTIKVITGLLKGKQYYWRVKVKSAASVDLWSNVWSFKTTTPLPAMPQLVSAFPTYQNRADYITYKWNAVQYTDQYLLQVSKEQTFAAIFKSATTSDTLKSISGHAKGDLYYWRVQATSFAGAGPWSDVQSFIADVTSVKEEEGIPTEYSISQNYPNPFNPTTTINFALPKTALTKISIYDLLGREIRALVNKELKAGYHEMSIDASSLTSGIYFYRIQSGNFIQTKKMILMR